MKRNQIEFKKKSEDFSLRKNPTLLCFYNKVEAPIQVFICLNISNLMAQGSFYTLYYEKPKIT